MADGFIKPEDQEPDSTGFEFYLDAFSELGTTRQIGMSVGAIPFTAIAEYFRMYELEDFDEFAYVIRRMDRVYLELNSAAAEAEGKAKTSGPTDPNKKANHRG